MVERTKIKSYENSMVTPTNDKHVVELSVMSDIVIAYEKEHFPIEKEGISKAALGF